MEIIMEEYVIFGVITLIVVLLGFAIIHVYNKLVKGRNRVNTQWAQVDVQLMRRSDLIPNLVDTVKGYASHEKEVLEKLATARNVLGAAATPGQAITANESLSAQLQRLLVIAEAYPDLKADKGFIELQIALKETEDKIAYARQFYNDTVLVYKNILHTFPSNIVAKTFCFQDESYYIVDDNKKREVSIHEN